MRIQIFTAPRADQVAASAEAARPLRVIEFVRREGSVVDLNSIFQRIRAGMVTARMVVDAAGRSVEVPVPTPSLAGSGPASWDDRVAVETAGAESVDMNAVDQHLRALTTMMECTFAEVQLEGYQAVASISAVAEYCDVIAASGVLPRCAEHIKTATPNIRRCAATILANVYGSRVSGVAASESVVGALLDLVLTTGDFVHLQGQREAMRALANLCAHAPSCQLLAKLVRDRESELADVRQILGASSDPRVRGPWERVLVALAAV
jgi:hypothetical protein